MAGQVLAFAAAAAGIASGILWWRAATSVVRQGEPNSKGNFFINGIDVQTTLNEQRKFNVFAAGATGLAAFLSGLAPLFH